MSSKTISEKMNGLFSDDPPLVKSYQRNTLGIEKKISGVFFPESNDDLIKIVNLANEMQLKLYPISAGKNWGYGNASPVVDDSMIVDLSRMNKIRHFDPELGVITLEAGVTLQQLSDFLEEKKASFICPINGAGPRTSIVGNLLEKGTSISGPTVESLRAIEAVLPDGTIYKNALWSEKENNMSIGYRWGLGPYLDGLFLQGNIGIVTAITIALPPLSKHMSVFFIGIQQFQELENVMQSANTLNQLLGRNFYFTLHLSNQFLYLDKASQSFYDFHHIVNAQTKFLVTGWMNTGDKMLHQVFKKIVMKTYKKNGITPKLFEIKDSYAGEKWLNRFSLLKHLFPECVTHYQFLKSTAELFLGHANEARLISLYQYAHLPINQNCQPEKDGLGIIWFTTIVLPKARLVQSFYEMVEKVCKSYHFDPMIILYHINHTALQAFVSIVFDLNNPEKIKASDDCYQVLLEEGKQYGFIPCRIPVSQMSRVIDDEQVSWQCVQKIKSLFDPNNMISYKRYS